MPSVDMLSELQFIVAKDRLGASVYIMREIIEISRINCMIKNAEYKLFGTYEGLAPEGASGISAVRRRGVLN